MQRWLCNSYINIFGQLCRPAETDQLGTRGEEGGIPRLTLQYLTVVQHISQQRRQRGGYWVSGGTPSTSVTRVAASSHCASQALLLVSPIHCPLWTTYITANQANLSAKICTSKNSIFGQRLVIDLYDILLTKSIYQFARPSSHLQVHPWHLLGGLDGGNVALNNSYSYNMNKEKCVWSWGQCCYLLKFSCYCHCYCCCKSHVH